MNTNFTIFFIIFYSLNSCSFAADFFYARISPKAVSTEKIFHLAARYEMIFTSSFRN